MEHVDSKRNGCGPRAASQPHLRTHGIASFDPDAQSNSFDFARLENRPHASLETPLREDFYQIVWVTEGGGSHVIDWKSHAVRSDVVFCMAPGQVHSWAWNKARGGATGFVLNFSVEFAYRCMQPEIGKTLCLRLMRRSDTDALYLDACQASALYEILEQLEREYEGDAFGRSGAVQAYLELFLIRLERCYPVLRSSECGNSGAILTQKLRTLVEARFRHRLSVHDYATLLAVSESHLCHAVRKHIGMTATQLIRERVLVEAKRLLLYGGANISEVGATLGFDDPAYFSRLFKKHTGQSPKAFKSAFEKASCRLSA